MRKIKVVVLLVRQLQHGFTKNAKVSPNLTVTILLFENIRNTVFGHFPSFPASSFMPRLTYLQRSDTMWCKAGFILCTP